mgnify:CR=1 FL=1
MMQGFANRLPRFSRKQLFISYSHQDRPWLEVVKGSATSASVPTPLAEYQALPDTSTPLDALGARDLVIALATMGRKVAAALDDR